MNQFLVVFLVAVFTFFLEITGVPVDEAHLQEYEKSLHNLCVEETGVSNDLIELARKGQFTDDRKLKCYLECYLRDANGFDENTGTVLIDKLLAKCPDSLRERVRGMVMPCTEIKGADMCDTAYLTHICWEKQDPEMYAMGVQ